MTESKALSPEQEERLARYRAGAMSDDERAAFEWEALSSDALAEALYGEISLDAVAAGATKPEGARERPLAVPAPDVHPKRRSRGLGRWLPLAASLLFVMGIAIWTGKTQFGRPRGVRVPGGEGLRGGAPALSVIEPVGDLPAAPRRFRWTRDPGAASYRVELFDPGSRRIGVAVTTDTTLALEALTHESIVSGQWRVVAIGADGLERPRHVRAVFHVAR